METQTISIYVLSTFFKYRFYFAQNCNANPASIQREAANVCAEKPADDSIE